MRLSSLCLFVCLSLRLSIQPPTNRAFKEVSQLPKEKNKDNEDVEEENEKTKKSKKGGLYSCEYRTHFSLVFYSLLPLSESSP